MRVQWILSLFVVVGLVAGGCGGAGGKSGKRGDMAGSNDPSDTPDMAKPGDPPVVTGDVGSPCTMNEECSGGVNAVCVDEAMFGWPNGYCMIDNCDATNDDCPAGAACFTFSDESTSCLKTCETAADCPTGYACPSYGACTPGCEADGCEAGEVCDSETHECVSAPCTADSCPMGTLCGDNGKCVADLANKPTGSVPTCDNLPELLCTGPESECGKLEQFDPHQGVGYDDYPINGETASKQYRSWARHDMIQLIKYATAVVACKAGDWNTGNGGLLGLGDMSDKFGDIPGTHDINDKVVNMQGHPDGTHENGLDMDIAYYQVGTANNYLREVCPHTSGGDEQYHCTDTPDKLDVWRSALFLGTLLEFDRVRVIGVDGKVGPLVQAAAEVLCADGWLPQKSCTNFDSKITWEETDMGYGWFLFHLHHLHISLKPKSSTGGTAFDGGKPAHHTMNGANQSMASDVEMVKKRRVPGLLRSVNPRVTAIR